MRFLAAFSAAAFLMTAAHFAHPVAAQDKGPAKGLAAPTGLWAAQTSPTEITLVWNPVPGAVGFKISSKSGVINVGKLNRYVIPITAFGIPIGYSLEAISEKGLVSPRAAFPVVTPEKATATDAIPRPGSVTARETGPGIITVTWTAVPAATAYFLNRTVAPEGLKTLCPICPTRTEYVDSAATAGAKHTYGVQAIGPGGTSQRTMSNEVITAAGPGPDPDPPTGGADGVPKDPVTAGCTGGERYKTCISATYSVGLSKTGSAFCPGGYAAIAGGYEGDLTTALVLGSRPTGTAKERSGWTVTVGRLVFPAGGEPAYVISNTARFAVPIRFTVFVVCGPDS